MNSSVCWCGHAPLEPWNADYHRCAACDTLVLATPPEPALGRVDDDQADFYGRQYWFAHQQTMGLPSIVERARLDLVDRVPDWMRALLRFRTPPARTLELGCSHGAFVALMRQAGFDATGLELSPAIATFAREAFGIDVLVGPLEGQSLPDASIDVVVAMDVLEHLTDPLATLGAVARVADDPGLVLVQTPRYPEGTTFEDLQRAGDPFLAMLLPREHTFLFSERAVTLLLSRVGFPHVTFTAAVFAQYDMCLLASRRPLAEISADDQARALLASPGGRMVQALLDHAGEVLAVRATLAQRDAEVASLSAAIASAEADRAARLTVIEDQGAAFSTATHRADALEAMVGDLRSHLAQAELDRQARLEVIERQGAELAAISHRAAESSARAEALEQHLATCEADRAARLAVIEQQGAALDQLQAAVGRIDALEAQLAASEAVIEQQAVTLADKAQEIERCEALVAEQAALRARLDTLETFARRVAQSSGARILQRIGWMPEPPGSSS
jgi:SAM-dependent methyltransferase